MIPGKLGIFAARSSTLTKNYLPHIAGGSGRIPRRHHHDFLQPRRGAVLMHLGSTAIGLVAVMLLGASAPAAALETVTIRDCYDGDTCTTTKGEKIRLARIDTPELRGKRADPNPSATNR